MNRQDTERASLNQNNKTWCTVWKEEKREETNDSKGRLTQTNLSNYALKNKLFYNVREGKGQFWIDQQKWMDV
jgi:hypothetical protein